MDKQKVCSTCKGAGSSSSNQSVPCSQCAGTGLDSVVCETCKGIGMISQQTNLLIKIPKSVDQLQLLRVRERGNQALNENYGDLILDVRIKPSKIFVRKGFDVYSEKKISVSKAIFGGSCKVETLEGEKTVNISPGTQHDQ